MLDILSDPACQSESPPWVRAGFASWIAMIVGLVACAATPLPPSEPGERSPRRAGTSGRSVSGGTGNLDRWVFRDVSASPEPAAQDASLSFCGAFDKALGRVAMRLSERSARGLSDLDTEELDFALRAEGEPHVRPEVWIFVAPAAEGDAVRERAERWLSTLRSSGERRCGVGRSIGRDGSHVTVLVAVDALADLDPLPVKARPGQWIRFSATLLVDAADAHLVVLPPNGTPRTLLFTTLHGRSSEAVFSVDRRGPWKVQLVGTVLGGPRPLLEATLYVDEDAPNRPGDRPAPGEGAAGNAGDDREALEHIVNAARAEEGIIALDPSPELARLARDHAEAMRRARLLAHDVGDGGPVDRIRRAGVDASLPGENVAHARSIARAHRVLWASPSHRGNLLDPSFSKFGIGVARDSDGSVWVCELFSNSDGAGIGPRVQPY